VKCPVCVREGLESTLRGGNMSMTTDMYFPPWYDKEGVYHRHDGNTHTDQWECSNGHLLSRVRIAKCPAGDWGGEEKITETTTHYKAG
jgi:hypothetical protein